MDYETVLTSIVVVALIIAVFGKYTVTSNSQDNDEDQMWCAEILIKCKARSIKQQSQCCYSNLVNGKCEYKDKKSFCCCYGVKKECVIGELG